MNVIYLLIFVCNLVNVKSESEDEDEKYIDLLPEQEKRDFLEKVERRLLTSVKTKDSPYKSSGEISDDHLNQHNDFVRQVLQEESDNMRRQKDAAMVEKKDKQSNEQLDVKGLENRLAPHIDLTLRNGQRFRRSDESVKVTDETLAPDNYKIPVKTIYDVTTDKPPSNVTENIDEVKSITSTTLSSAENIDGQDIQVRGIKRNSRRAVDDTKDVKTDETKVSEENMGTFTKSDDGEPEYYLTTTNELTELDTTTKQTENDDKVRTTDDHESNSETKSEREFSHDDNKNKSSVEIKEIETTQAPVTLTITTINYKDQTTSTFLSETTNNDNYVTLNSTKKKDNLRTKLSNVSEESHLQIEDTTNKQSVKESTESEKSTNSIIEITNSNIDNKIRIVTQKPNDLIKHYNAIDINNNKTYLEEAKAVTITKSNEDIIIDTTTIVPPIATTPNISAKSKLPYLDLKNKTENSTKEISIISNLANILRLGLELSYQKDSQEWPPVKKYNDKKERKAYSVYEVASNEQPFVKVKPKYKQTRYKKKSNKQKEQPYYVPVYNYEPKNAYFNPYNQLGPNYKDEHGDFIDDIKERIISENNLKEEEYENLDSQDEEEEILKHLKYGNKHISGVTERKPKRKPPLFKHKLPYVVKKPKYTEIYFEPKNQWDLDYYFGNSNKPNIRSRKKQGKNVKEFPDTDDETHPYTSLKNGNAKDHISAVRQVLYQKNIFTYMHPLTTTEIPDEDNANDSTNTTDKTVLRKEYKYDLRASSNNVEEPIKTLIVIGEKNSNNNVPYKPNKRIKDPHSHTKGISVDYYFGIDDYSKRLLRSDNNSSLENNGLSAKSQYLTHEGSVSLRAKKKKKKGNEEVIKDKGTVKELIDMDRSFSVLNHLEQLLKLNIPLARRHKDGTLAPYLTVLKDMIDMDNDALVQYDWLGTTVDVLSALKKLSVLSESLRQGRELHPLDWQLLKYVQYLHKTAKAALISNPDVPVQRAKLPRSKRRKRHQEKWLKTKGLINRVWLYIRDRIPSNSNEEPRLENDINEFKSFVIEMQLALNELHTALKYVAGITNYKKQRWFKNLKELYLKDADNKKLLEVMLHIFTTRLVNLIEESTRNGLSEGYTEFIEKNENAVQRTKEEFVLVLKVLEEIKNI